MTAEAVGYSTYWDGTLYNIKGHTCIHIYIHTLRYFTHETKSMNISNLRPSTVGMYVCMFLALLPRLGPVVVGRSVGEREEETREKSAETKVSYIKVFVEMNDDLHSTPQKSTGTSLSLSQTHSHSPFSLSVTLSHTFSNKKREKRKGKKGV